MKPFILNFAEKPRIEDLNVPIAEYSEAQNLTVIKGTNVPAIKYADEKNKNLPHIELEMKSRLKKLMDTSTRTEAIETSDSD